MTPEPATADTPTATAPKPKRRRTRYEKYQLAVLFASLPPLVLAISSSALDFAEEEAFLGLTYQDVNTGAILVLIAALTLPTQVPWLRRTLRVPPGGADEREIAIDLNATRTSSDWLSFLLFAAVLLSRYCGDALEPYVISDARPYLTVLIAQQAFHWLAKRRAQRRM